MNLDLYENFKQIDPQDMLGQIDGLPDQLQNAWELGQKLELPDWSGIERVAIGGMGGSAIGADLLAASISTVCTVPVTVHRDYDLPAWVLGPQTLVICSSHSGNTEETISNFKTARGRNCRMLSIATGGELAALSKEAGTPLWIFEHHGQPRAAVGFSFGLLLAAFARLKLIPDPATQLEEAVAGMRANQAPLRAAVPTPENPAKRLAGQLIGRWVVVMGADLLAPVARRWKGQISELAKAWAQFEILPEADHNSLAGNLNPEDLVTRTMAIFLEAPANHPRNRLRLNFTRQAFMVEGWNTDMIHAQGRSPLAQMWTCLHLGDYTAYYLAMAYGMDPTPVAALENFKQEMKTQ